MFSSTYLLYIKIVVTRKKKEQWPEVKGVLKAKQEPSRVYGSQKGKSAFLFQL